jgi:hypothetical protein
MYKEASHTIPYPTSRSPGKRELVLTGEIRTSVVSGKTHSTVTSLRTGAMAFFKDLTICWGVRWVCEQGCLEEAHKDFTGMNLRGMSRKEENTGLRWLLQQWTHLCFFNSWTIRVGMGLCCHLL